MLYYSGDRVHLELLLSGYLSTRSIWHKGMAEMHASQTKHQHFTPLSLDSTPLHALLHLSFFLFLKVLLLILCAQLLELRISLDLLDSLPLKLVLLLLLRINDLLKLVLLHLASGSDFLVGEVGKVSLLNKKISDAEEVLEHWQASGVTSIGGWKLHREVDALLRNALLDDLGLVDRLIGNNKVLKVVAGRLNSCDKLRGEHRLSNLMRLRHDGSPDWKLWVVLGRGNAEIEAVVAKFLHDVLVDNGENEVVVVGLGVQLIGAWEESRNGASLLAIEWVHNSINHLNWVLNGLHEERSKILNGQDNWVVALQEGKLDINESDVLATSAVGDEGAQGLLFNNLSSSGTIKSARKTGALSISDSGLLWSEADQSVLLLHDRRVDFSPPCSTAAVGAHTVEVDSEEDNGECEDVSLHLEVGKGVALVNLIPLRVGGWIDLVGIGEESSSRVVSLDWSGLLSSKVGEVWDELAMQLRYAPHGLKVKSQRGSED